MPSNESRRGFMKNCVQAGGACCALLLFNKHLSAKDDSQKPKPATTDFTKLSYCGIACETQCELYKATAENNDVLKKKVYDEWKWKEKFNVEFDPQKVFCWGCKPADKPLKIGMDVCDVRNCAMENKMGSCIRCRNLTACDKKFWKEWPAFYGQVKKMQAQYMTEPGAALVDLTAKKAVD
jgi:hypothetical protein